MSRDDAGTDVTSRGIASRASWWGIACIWSAEPPRCHHSPRRRRCVAARGTL